MTGLLRRRRRSEDGSVSLELVVLGPGLLLFISVLVYGGRVALAGQSVQQAAEEAAREASIARTQGEADRLAGSSAKDTLAQQNLQCTTLTVHVNTTGFNTSAGQPASVTATVRCPVKVGDLLIPGLPGTKTVTASATSPIDTYRERR